MQRLVDSRLAYADISKLQNAANSHRQFGDS